MILLASCNTNVAVFHVCVCNLYRFFCFSFLENFNCSLHLYRIKKHIFTSSEVQRLAEAIICLFLDRQMQGLTMLLCECLQSLIHYFTDEECKACCEKIAKSLVCRYWTLPSYVKYLGYTN